MAPPVPRAHALTGYSEEALLCAVTAGAHIAEHENRRVRSVIKSLGAAAAATTRRFPSLASSPSRLCTRRGATWWTQTSGMICSCHCGLELWR